MAWIKKKTNQIFNNLNDEEKKTDYIEADDLIAEQVAKLNQKGWLTKESSAGHPYPNLYYLHLTRDDCLALDFGETKAPEKTVEKPPVPYCTYRHRSAYIVFKDDIKLPCSAPEGWVFDRKENAVLCKFNVKLNALDFYEAVIERIRKLNAWIDDLCDYNS